MRTIGSLCTGMAGWRQSRGANLEYEVAVGLGMKVLMEGNDD